MLHIVWIFLARIIFVKWKNLSKINIDSYINIFIKNPVFVWDIKFDSKNLKADSSFAKQI